MKYDKFEGSLGEFLESYAKEAIDFYKYYKEFTCPLKLQGNDIKTLVDAYNQGVYTEKEEVWTDHLPVLCWVKYRDLEIKSPVIITEFNDGFWKDTYGYRCYNQAVPVTQEEIDKFIWKGKL